MTDLQAERKKDHIQLAMASRTERRDIDERFYYEPLLSQHPTADMDISQYFLKKELRAPIWISSMTGGTGPARHINQNLAKACGDFGLSMGLGSCRVLLESDEYLEDFQLRPLLGDQPFYANLGIAQINELIISDRLHLINEMLAKLETDGLIIHVNPTQEWLQPEGDEILGYSPLQAIQRVIDHVDTSIIVKEVGQGMGPASLRALLELSIDAIEFAAFGGTNFAKLENLRDPRTDEIDPLCYVGHTIDQMIGYVEAIDPADIRSEYPAFILSGGIKDYLDGYYYNQKMSYNSVYGQASGFLKHAQGDYETLAYYVEQQIKGYKFATRYLTLKG